MTANKDKTNPTTMKFEAKVDQMRGRLKSAWGELTDDDIDRAEGRWDRIVATIREKTGESLEAISARVDRMIDRVRDAGSPQDDG